MASQMPDLLSLARVMLEDIKLTLIDDSVTTSIVCTNVSLFNDCCNSQRILERVIVHSYMPFAARVPS